MSLISDQGYSSLRHDSIFDDFTNLNEEVMFHKYFWPTHEALNTIDTAFESLHKDDKETQTDNESFPSLEKQQQSSKIVDLCSILLSLGILFFVFKEAISVLILDQSMLWFLRLKSVK